MEKQPLGCVTEWEGCDHTAGNTASHENRWRVKGRRPGEGDEAGDPGPTVLSEFENNPPTSLPALTLSWNERLFSFS